MTRAPHTRQVPDFPAPSGWMRFRPLRLLQEAILMLLFISQAQLIIFFMIRKLDWLDVMDLKE
jgi:hypothetical protein